MRRIGRKARHYWVGSAVTLGLIAMVLLVTLVRSAAFAVHPDTSKDWSTFMGSNARMGYNAKETIINPTTAPNLKLHWTAKASGHVTSEPLVVNGVAYWGAWDGSMHATDITTGQDLWATNLGTKPGSCSGLPHGLIGSQTVATVSIQGVATPVVFAVGGQDNVTALNAKTGQIIWQTNLGNDPAEFLYSSTSVYNGSVYVGVASSGDCPLVLGQIVQMNASTGQIQHTIGLAPSGCIGVGVWGSLAIDKATGMLYVGTGNVQHLCKVPAPLQEAVLELNASDLSLVASWAVPASQLSGDDDFGSTPTFFKATINGVTHPMLGLVNKNGIYYALDRNKISAGPLWEIRVSLGGHDPNGKASIASSAYDGKNLYVAGSMTTIGGQQCAGSLQQVDPSTGAVGWQKCFTTGPVLGGLITVPGLVVVGAGNTMSVVDSATGNTLFSYQDTATTGSFRGTATILNGMLYDGSWSGRLFAFGF